ncbi:MAG: head GIN domain-containing protein [Sphingomicrobium sp.]
MIRTLTIAAAALVASACNVGAKAEERDPGSSVSRTYQLGAFDKIEVSGPYDVIVTTGGRPGASATGGGKLLDETEVLVEGNVLKIRPKKKAGISFNWGKRGSAKFAVTTAMLNGAAIAGSGGVSVDKVTGDFKGAIGGSGDLDVAAIAGGAVDLSIGGSGSITAAGTAQSTNIKIGGSGDVDASRLAAKTASVAIGGSGNARANATVTAKVSLAGAGDVAITGGAKCSISKVGSGDFTCS